MIAKGKTALKYNKKHGFLFFCAVCLLLSLLAGCAKPPEPVQTPPPAVENPIIIPKPEPPIVEPEPTGPADPLTGLVTEEKIAKTIPIAVMINNYHLAFPQYGIAKAGIIYECMAEGSITRLMAIFNNYADIPEIGPVRSARDYFIDLAYNHGAYYIHYGGSPQAYAKVKSNAVKNLDGLSSLDGIMFWRDKERLKKGSYMIEHSVFTSGEKIIKGLNYKKYETESTEEIAPAFLFVKEDYTPSGGVVANKVTIPYGTYTVPIFTYDKERKLYLREQVKGAHIDGATGEQLAVKNVLVLYVPQKIIAKDKAGRLDIDMITKGKGLYITNGVAVPILFEKKALKEPIVYTTQDGKTLEVNCGQTFINCLDNSIDAIVEE